MFRYFGADPNKKWTKEELIAYDNASIVRQDARGRLIAAEREGRRGVTVKVIGRCLQNNMSIELISEIVDLPIDEVQNIITQLEA